MSGTASARPLQGRHNGRGRGRRRPRDPARPNHLEGAREAAWNRYQPPPPPPPPPRIAPREVEVAWAAEKKQRAYARIAKLKAKKAAATSTVMAVSVATSVTTTRIPAGIVADERWPGMYRVKLGRGQLSDMLNLTRTKDALASRR